MFEKPVRLRMMTCPRRSVLGAGLQRKNESLICTRSGPSDACASCRRTLHDLVQAVFTVDVRQHFLSNHDEEKDRCCCPSLESWSSMLDARFHTLLGCHKNIPTFRPLAVVSGEGRSWRRDGRWISPKIFFTSSFLRTTNAHHDRYPRGSNHPR
jgi:hypothetical protein